MDRIRLESTQDKLKQLSLLTLCSELSEPELQSLAAQGVWHNWLKGQILFQEGEQALGLHIIIRGLVKVFHINQLGRERVLHVIRAGICGEAAVFPQGTYPATAATLSNSLVLYVPRVVLLSLLAANSSFSLRMMTALSLRLRMFTRKLEAQGYSDALQRLVAYLLHRVYLDYTLSSEPVTKSHVLQLEVSREVLANMLGLARETLSRTFSRLQQMGLLKLEGRKIIILDLHKLYDLEMQTT